MSSEKTKETEEKKEEEKEEKPQIKKEEKVKKEVKKEEKPKKKVKVPEKFKKLVKDIEDLKVSDLAELVKILEEKLGVSAAPQVIPAPAAAAEAPTAAAPAKQIFTIELKTIGEKKIEVIKAVRDVAGKGLKEAKDLVDAVASGPQVLKENVKKEEAEEIKKKLEAAGATVELK